MRAGDAVLLLDGRGRCGRGRIAPLDAGRRGGKSARKAGVCIEVETIETVPPPSRRVRIWTAAPKGDRLDWLIEKCTELGVFEIRFVAFDRSVAGPGEAASRWSRTAIEACKQSGRAWLPRLSAGATLDDALTEALSGALSAAAGATLLLADPARENPWLAQRLADPPAADVVVIVGPEGGLTETERGRLLAAGAVAVRLAEPILRIETAAIAAAAVAAGAR